MIERQLHSFRSAEEAIQFVTRQMENRLDAVHDRLVVIEAALKSLFAANPDAADVALAISKSIEAPPHPEGLEDRIASIATRLRDLAQAGTEDAQERVKLSVVEGGLSTKE